MQLGNQLDMMHTCWITVTKGQKLCVLEGIRTRLTSPITKGRTYLPDDVKRLAVARACPAKGAVWVSGTLRCQCDGAFDLSVG